MKRTLLIALVAIAVLGLMAPAAARAHDGPVMAVVLDAATPVVGVAALPPAVQHCDCANLLVASNSLLDPNYQDSGGGCANDERAAHRSKPYQESDHRARDVPRGEHGRG